MIEVEYDALFKVVVEGETIQHIYRHGIMKQDKSNHAVQFLLHKFEVFYGYIKGIIVHGTCNESL